MPIYEYRCGACGHEFELIQKITDSPKRKCEACGRLKAKRLISASNFQLKGTGWYVTDYGGKKPSDNEQPTAASGKSESKGKGAGKDSSAGSSKSSDAKSDAKSDGKSKPKSKGESAAA